MRDIGKKVQNFYNQTPFPDYELERFQDQEDLKLAAYDFARVLDRSIPEDASVIDVGIGTGQLSAFLSLRRECVYGIDFSESSLAKAKSLKEKLHLNSWHLSQVDILNEDQINEIGMKFDYVLCLGVLHHTEDAYTALKNIIKLLKPNGYIAIGLYNKYGRILHKIRIVLTKTIFKNNNKIKDAFVRIQIGNVEDTERARGWWHDQYLHPHETSHTVGEVLRWFKKNNIEYMQTVPHLQWVDESDLDIAGAWNDAVCTPHLLLRAYRQLCWIYQIHHDGGYWITFGRNKR